MNILDYIPVGHKNAVTRQQLCIMTGISDRKVRNMIAETRRATPILNLQNGKGYFLPNENDLIDRMALRKFVNQEEHRLKSIGWSLKAARDYAKELCC